MNNLNGKDTKSNDQGNSTSNPDEVTKKKFLKFFSNPIENTTDFFIELATAFGVVAVIVAGLMPFIIKYFFLGDKNYKTYSSLGPIGDYIGGTTVAVLTAASVFLLLATIIMQRKEIKISQRGIDELVKQTAASVQQAEEARKEVMITNETMRKQQFESTFFSMISLHQNLLDRLKSEHNTGFQVVEESLKNFRDNYIVVAHEKFKKLCILDHYADIVDLVGYLQMLKYYPSTNVHLESKAEVLKFYEELDFREIFYLVNGNKMISDFNKFTYQDAKDIYIDEAFYYFIIPYERFLSSYFNSITTIIKFLASSEYEVKDKENTTEENKVYREIFFSQLSPQEMVLIYYYAKYYPTNEWLLEELKAYNLFYPRLVETVLLFPIRDRKNIQELSAM